MLLCFWVKIVKCKKLFSVIDELNDKYIKVWEDVCNIESQTIDKAGVDAVCDYFVKMARERGWKIEKLELTDAGSPVCITLNPDAALAPVVFSGHADTVHPKGLFGEPPVHIEGDKIYGPGVQDCKGGIVSAFMAMDALDRVGFCERPIKLIIQTDEETSSKTSGKKTVEFMCEKAKDAAAFLNGEGLSNGTIVLQRKGIVRYRLNVTGKAAHSSKCYEGINAVAEAAYKILELEKMKDKDGLTCNCGVIEGGTVANAVAEKCSFLVDIRFANEDQFKIAEETVKRVAATSYLDGSACELETVSLRPSMPLCDRNIELFNKMNEIYSQNGLPVFEMGAANGGSDAAYITQLGVPCVDDVGVLGGRIHSKEEFAYISSLVQSAKLNAAVAYCL